MCYLRFPESTVEIFSDILPLAVICLFAELNTPDALQYHYYPINDGFVQFRVRAPNDAHLALTGEPNETRPMMEVFIGGWQNSKSVIRFNQTKPDVVEADTPNILSGNEFRGFWIRVIDGVSVNWTLQSDRVF